MDEPRKPTLGNLFVGRDTTDEGMDTCRNCWLPRRVHRGERDHCPIAGPASIDYAASVGAPWAVRIVEKRLGPEAGAGW